jgi:hypothetical protein
MNLPPAHPNSYAEERIYPAVGPLGTSEPKIWTECLFVDPVSDIAVLGKPDTQSLSDECEAYEEFMEQTTALPFRRPVQERRRRLAACS